MKNDEQKHGATGWNNEDKSLSQRGFLLSRMKFLLSLAVAFICLGSAQAEVIIYKHRITVTEHKDQSLTKTNYTGWTFLNITTSELGLVKVFNNSFEIQNPEWDKASILGVAGRTEGFGALAIYENDFAGLTAQGISRSIEIGTNWSSKWSIPRTLAVSGIQLIGAHQAGVFIEQVVPSSAQSFNLHYPTSTLPVFKKFTGSLVFDRANTLLANHQQLDTEGVILHFTNLLLAKGYQNVDQEVENPNGPANPTGGGPFQPF